MTTLSRFAGFREVDQPEGGSRPGTGIHARFGAGGRAGRGRAGRSAPRTAPRARSRAVAQRWARAASTMHRCAAGGRRRPKPALLILGPRASSAFCR